VHSITFTETFCEDDNIIRQHQTVAKDEHDILGNRTDKTKDVIEYETGTCVSGSINKRSQYVLLRKSPALAQSSSVFFSVCLSACLPACLFSFLSVCLSVCLSVLLSSVYPSVCLSICLSVCLSVSLTHLLIFSLLAIPVRPKTIIDLQLECRLLIGFDDASTGAKDQKAVCRPDPDWYLPATHSVQLASAIRPNPVWYLPGSHHAQSPSWLRPVAGTSQVW
jgi:hypothetical protein